MPLLNEDDPPELGMLIEFMKAAQNSARARGENECKIMVACAAGLIAMTMTLAKTNQESALALSILRTTLEPYWEKPDESIN